MPDMVAARPRPGGAVHDSSVALRGPDAVDLQGRDFAGLVAPLGAQVGQHGGDVAVVQFQHRWGHAKRAWVPSGGRSVPAIEHQLHEEVQSLRQEIGELKALLQDRRLDDYAPLQAVRGDLRKQRQRSQS